MNLTVSVLLTEKVQFYVDLHESSNQLFHLVESNAQQWKSWHYIKSSHLGFGGKLTIIFVTQTLLKDSPMAVRASHEEIPAVGGQWPVLTNGRLRTAAAAAQRSGWVGLFLHFLPWTAQEGLQWISVHQSSWSTFISSFRPTAFRMWNYLSLHVS